MIDTNSQAARDFYQRVRTFSQNAKAWDANVIWYESSPDERFDLSRVSFRVYGRWSEFLTVMAAAGLDTFDQSLDQTTLALPTESVLYQLKRAAGFESMHEYRDGLGPSWIAS
jgi:hypothetical protein